MPLHKLVSVTVGVPDVAGTRDYYTDFGLGPAADGWLSTTDGGRQLRLVRSDRRRLVELRIGVDDPDDLDRAEAALRGLGLPSWREDAALVAEEAVAGFRAVLEVPRAWYGSRRAPRPT
ncbi:MAG: dioxygenase, partial [Pseudonocardia sp.]|nr:dioxygenase [Pseudonocardia sp.]